MARAGLRRRAELQQPPNPLYGLYQGSNGFLELLHRAPGCGSWGFVVPTSRRLISAVLDLCPETIDFAPAPRKHPVNPLRPLWRQAAMYMLLLIPGAALAFFTGAMMLLRASELALPLSVVGLTLAAWSLGGWMLGMSSLYAVGMVVVAAHLAWQAWRFDLDRPEVSYRLFLANILTGVLLAGAALAGTF